MTIASEKKMLYWIIGIVTSVNVALMSFSAITTWKYYDIAIEMSNKIISVEKDVERINEKIKDIK